MDRHQDPPYPEGGFTEMPDENSLGRFHAMPTPNSETVLPASLDSSLASSYPDHHHSQEPQDDAKFDESRPSAVQRLKGKKISKKWQRRLYWVVPLGLLAILLVVLFEVYKDDFERWVSPLANWLTKRDSWSWVIPVAILFSLSFPPLFGHEIVQIIVGLSYPIGIAIGIACAGAILGEAACFLVFKYGFTWWVDKKIATKVKWAAVTRVAQEAGFRGVLIIRYSIVPPHLANPLFSCTGMKFWLYMITVVLSLPKTIVFVILGAPTAKNSKVAKWAKVVAIGVVVIITIFASIWIRKKMTIAIEEIEAERGISHTDEEQGDEELGMLGQQPHSNITDDTSYRGVGTAVPYPYQDAGGPQTVQRA